MASTGTPSMTAETLTKPDPLPEQVLVIGRS